MDSLRFAGVDSLPQADERDSPRGIGEGGHTSAGHAAVSDGMTESRAGRMALYTSLMRFCMLILTSVAAFPAHAQVDKTLKALQRGGHVIVMRHASAPREL